MAKLFRRSYHEYLLRYRGVSVEPKNRYQIRNYKRRFKKW